MNVDYFETNIFLPHIKHIHFQHANVLYAIDTLYAFDFIKNECKEALLKHPLGLAIGRLMTVGYIYHTSFHVALVVSYT